MTNCGAPGCTNRSANNKTTYPGMIARARLAVLDFYSGVALAHCKNKQGDSNTSTNFQKPRNLGSLKNIRKERKGNVQNHIMDEIKHLQMTSSNSEMPILANVPKYIEGVEKPEKAQTISNLKSQFKIKE